MGYRQQDAVRMIKSIMMKLRDYSVDEVKVIRDKWLKNNKGEIKHTGGSYKPSTRV